MKYNPVDLFDLKLYEETDGSPMIDIACSRELLEYCVASLEALEKTPEDETEMMAAVSAAIIEFAYSQARKN